jgi:hypothetical protein
MIFYGTKATPVGLYAAERLKCQNCGEENQLQFAVFARYFHLYWIPTIPLGKVAVSSCQHCQHAMEHKEFKKDQQYQYAYERIKAQTSTPKWHFAGLFLIAVLISWVSISGIRSGEQMNEYLAQPQVGDVYHLKAEEGFFSSMRITAVEGDKLYFVLNEYSVNKASAITTIDKSENYSEEVVAVLRSDIAELNEQQKILRIKR